VIEPTIDRQKSRRSIPTRKSTVFQRLQFPVDYQENCRDDNIQFADHSKELLGDSRPKTLFQRNAEVNDVVFFGSPR
jgi:hypothetical protein